MFFMAQPPRLCSSEGGKHGVSIQSSLNMGDTRMKNGRDLILTKLYILQSSIISQILEFFY